MREDTIGRTISGDRFTPAALTAKLKAAVLLESATVTSGRDRYSLILVDRAFMLAQKDEQVLLLKDDTTHILPGPTILEAAGELAREHAGMETDFPLPAGGAGFLGYEFAAHCDSITFDYESDQHGLYDAQLIFSHVIIVFDHASDLLHIIGLNYSIESIDLEKAIEKVIDRLNDLDFTYLAQPAPPASQLIEIEKGADQAFLDGVARIKDHILQGDLLQGVLSRSRRVHTTMSALDAYRRLRALNPSPYMFYLDFGKYELFGASPEVMVRVRGRQALLRPIAGTRPRGRNAEEDERLAAELLEDEKERAEHLMLIDLARNDLGRVCKPGSVKVTERMHIEYYSHVMHIVSEVKGELADGLDGIDAFKASFPAGTVSGAPKIRAMEILQGLESQKRGFYAGAVGYLTPEGGLDTCIAIRTALYRDNEIHLQAGAGIVYDSDPLKELQETDHKLAAFVRSLGLEE